VGRWFLTGITDELNQRHSTYSYIAFSPINQWPSVTTRAGNAGRVEFFYPNGANATNVSVTVRKFVRAGVYSDHTYAHTTLQGVPRRTNITGAICPSCGPEFRDFSPNGNNGNVSFSTDWNGNRTNFTYHVPRNLEATRTEGLTPAGATTTQTRTISTAWDATFRLPTVVTEPLRITTNTYDPDGSLCGARGALCSRSVQATSDPNGSGLSGTAVGSPRVWTYTYNANGRILTVDGPRDVSDVSDVTTYAYYANNAVCSTANGGHETGCRGQLASMTNALNQTTTVTEYNVHGQPLRMVDANGLVTTMAYDARQRMTSRTVGSETTIHTYNFAGLLTQVTLPDGSYLEYSYDAAHRLTGMQDNLGNRIAYTLDFAGNRTQEQVFDQTNALAQTRSRVYSSLSRLEQELGAYPAQTPPTPNPTTTTYTYDDQGNVKTVTDPLNHTTENTYDRLNRLQEVTRRTGSNVLSATQYGYNGLDALAQVTDPRSLVTTYTVNGHGETTQLVSPDTGTTASTYDLAGNLLTQTDAKGQTTTYTYDALNRVTLVVFNDSSRQTYVYDSGTNGIGRLASIEERNAANTVTSLLQYSYDAHGRVTSETRTPGGTVGYSYDAAGRLSGMTYPSGRTLTYSFDNAGRVNQLTTTKNAQSQVVVQAVTYHPFGGVKSFTLGNSQMYSRTIDLDGRISAYTIGGSSVAIGFDDASRIRSIGANTYDYDDLDRLKEAWLPSNYLAYTYDAVGNRLTKTVGTFTDTYSYYATSNRIDTLTPSSGPARTFAPGLNGSTLGDGVNTYTYDSRGRMATATSVAGTATYQVNALGQRVRKIIGATDLVFTYYRGGKLIAESDPGGTPRREYIYLGDIPVGVVQ
jgi:YD repeat-containing protein